MLGLPRKQKRPHRAAHQSGGDKGSRTPDLLNAIETLYQLSYIPREAKWGNYTIIPKAASTTPRTRLVKCGVAAGLSLGLDNPESRTAVRFDNMP